MAKERIKLSPEDRKRADELLGEIAGAQKELGLIIGRAAMFENAPDMILSTAPVDQAARYFARQVDTAERAASLSNSSTFAVLIDGKNCVVYDEVSGTCTPCD